MVGDTESEGALPIKASGKAKKEKPVLSLGDLRRFVNLKYGSEGAFARKMGWSVATVSRLLNGNWIPQKVEVINRISQELGFEISIISDLFSRMRNRPDFVTADTLESK